VPPPWLLSPHPGTRALPAKRWCSVAGVVVGAPHANTSQPGVAQPGAVFLCSWPLNDPPCQPLLIDTTGDETETQNTLNLHTYKSHQWLGASVTSWDGKLVACAPLQHWNAMDSQHEAFRTPTGACFVGAPGLRRVAWYSPCRDQLMASTYREIDDKRYCEIGFSAAVTPVRRCLGGWRVRGAPGDAHGDAAGDAEGVTGVVPGSVGTGLPCPTAGWCQGTAGVTSARLPAGYSVAVGEFDGDPKTKGTAGGGTGARATCNVGGDGSWAPLGSGVPSPPQSSGTRVGQDDVLVGAPLYMARRPDGQRSEVGRLYLYLGGGQRPLAQPPQTLTGTHPYGRFSAAIASLGDLDKDGYGDVAVGAPLGGDGGSGQVFIFRGQSEGLMPVPTQLLDSPFRGPAAFGFALRGATDLDGNGYPDLLVGAYGVAKVAGVTKYCALPGLDAELQLDRLKPRLSRRVLLLHSHQSSWHRALALTPGTPPLCHNLTAYLRDEADFKDKLSPVALSLSLALPRGTPGLVLYGDTLVQAQGQEKLSCNPRKENGSHVVLCELGNPMKAGAQITVDMELSVSGLEDMGDTITFQLQLWSKNSPSSTNASVTVTVPVEVQAEMELRGVLHPWVPGGLSPPQCHLTVLPQLHNKGPSTVSGVTLHLAVPSQLGGRILLYLLELGCCLGTAPWNGTHQRERREAEEPPGAGLEEPVPVVSGCSPGTCSPLAKDQRALVTVHALLWMDTLQQREHLLKQFLIHSRAWFNTSAMPYRIQPRVLPAGEAVTEVVRASPGGEGAVPVWWVVLGVLAGLLLLTFLILLMWKVRRLGGGHWGHR
uniref:Integrin subunit alpha 2b n=1 Tax=Strix occidentalis caurina TaxID=311401 RepID=A0A8D0FPM1_STROC